MSSIRRVSDFVLAANSGADYQQSPIEITALKPALGVSIPTAMLYLVSFFPRTNSMKLLSTGQSTRFFPLIVKFRWAINLTAKPFG